MGGYRFVPTTTYHGARAKVSDGKSVVVWVPENTTVELGKFYVLDGFLGASMASVKTGAGEASELTLNIEQAEYETDQINTEDIFDKGEVIYFDEVAKVFTTTAEGNRKAGRVSDAKDANGVILFILGPQI